MDMTAAQQKQVRAITQDTFGCRAMRDAARLSPDELTTRDWAGLHTWATELQKLRARPDYSLAMERALLQQIPNPRDTALLCRALLDPDFLHAANKTASQTKETTSLRGDPDA
tara:strand:+ start:2612 stop:2950 length:339 start_codon:yes stop_codon:yes gene_type:complete